MEQFQRFLERAGAGVDRYQLSPSFLNKYSPDSNGPWSTLDWYMAAHYCNWLSEQEGLPKEEWCYVPNQAGAYAEGMTIPADVLERTGYRLPTEAEWEYACRSGTVTSYYYGLSIELLGNYAWYQANSKEHAWSCGSLLPNDLGLFDMLGNEFEWVQDSAERVLRKKTEMASDVIAMPETVIEKNTRALRGGSFFYAPPVLRSALRVGTSPGARIANYGFRISRTYH